MAYSLEMPQIKVHTYLPQLALKVELDDEVHELGHPSDPRHRPTVGSLGHAFSYISEETLELDDEVHELEDDLDGDEVDDDLLEPRVVLPP